MKNKKFDIGKSKVRIGYKFYVLFIWNNRNYGFFIIPKFYWKYLKKE